MKSFKKPINLREEWKKLLKFIEIIEKKFRLIIIELYYYGINIGIKFICKLNKKIKRVFIFYIIKIEVNEIKK